jgi:hypothetical protein
LIPLALTFLTLEGGEEPGLGRPWRFLPSSRSQVHTGTSVPRHLAASAIVVFEQELVLKIPGGFV